MPAPPTKLALKDELTRILAVDLDTRERAYRASREAATHEEAKPENDKDTRALEQSYLARGEALRIEELKAGLADVHAMALRTFGEGDPAALSALVIAEENDAEVALWLAPYGGGNRLAGDTVQVVTPKSPLGRAILGKRPGDECEIALAGKTRVLAVVRVD
jgi:hypothetical protein